MTSVNTTATLLEAVFIANRQTDTQRHKVIALPLLCMCVQGNYQCTILKPESIHIMSEVESNVHCVSCSGQGCDFVLEPCDNPNTYPYLCDTAVLHQCTFDRVSRVSRI